jgi:hypothetical protein
MLTSSLLAVLPIVFAAQVELTPVPPAKAQPAFAPAPPAADPIPAPPRHDTPVAPVPEAVRATIALPAAARPSSSDAQQNAATETPGLGAPPSAPPLVETPGTKHWYGWSLALSDLAFTSIYESSPSTGARVTSAIGIGLVAPALHFAHRNYVMGSLSLVGRLALVGVMARVQLPASRIEAGQNCHDDTCKQTLDDVLPTLIVSVLGLGFMVLDDFAMARIEDRPDAAVATALARPRKSGLSLAPSFGATPDGASVALLGRF